MSGRPRLVCHIIHRLAVGGLENGLVNLINNLPDDYGHAIICMTEATSFRQRIRRPGVEIIELHKKPGKDPGIYWRMWKALRRLRPAIVHTRNFNTLDMILPAWLSGVRRFVHSEHGLDVFEIDGKNSRYNRLRRLSRLVVDRYIGVSRDLRGWLMREIEIPEDRVCTIYNGVDVDLFSPRGARADLPDGFAPDDACIIGTFGRFYTVKNQAALIQAFASIVERRPEMKGRLRLVLVGDGELRGELEAAIDATGIRDISWLPGLRNDTAELYRILDIFVLPSFREGISNTILEAMASGLPIIAGNVGGNPEIVVDGEVGQLVPPDAASMADAILAYVDHPDRLRRDGAAARAHTIAAFSLQTMMTGYNQIYTSLL